MTSTILRRAIAGAAATAAVLGLGLVAPASGSPADDPDLVAVRFEQVPTDDGGSDGPLSPAGSTEVANYVEFQVDHGGVTRRLRPLSGPITATPLVTEPAISVEIDGLRVGSAADGFDSTLGQVFRAASVGSFLRVDTGGVGEPAVVQVDVGRRLEPGDYLLVQEVGGDDAIEIEAIDTAGDLVGTRTIGPTYRWKTAHRSPDGSLHWASIVDVSDWVAIGDVTGFRVRTAKAEVKVLVLEPAVGVIPLPLAETDTVSEAPPIDDAPTAAVESSTGPAPVLESPQVTTPPPAPTTTSAPPEPLSEEPDLGPSSNPASQVLAQTDAPRPTALAMTGVSTDPWVLVALATGLIFFGYTTVVAFRRPSDEPGSGESSGHAQLDALGFD